MNVIVMSVRLFVLSHSCTLLSLCDPVRCIISLSITVCRVTYRHIFTAFHRQKCGQSFTSNNFMSNNQNYIGSAPWTPLGARPPASPFPHQQFLDPPLVTLLQGAGEQHVTRYLSSGELQCITNCDGTCSTSLACQGWE